MDSTPVQTVPNPKSKLPIKRKTLPSSQSRQHPSSLHHPDPNNPPPPPPPPPFKFHRIWTEADEIAFLDGLLHSGLLFPRDLNLFYHRFSTSISHPYSHSQLSEKLRRLRKKFRSFSSRLLRHGPNALSTLSPHDRALYQLSEKLWSPQFASSSPFANKLKADEVVDDVVSSNPNNQMDGDFRGGKIGEMASKIALDVFDRSMKEARIRMGLFCEGVLPPSQNVENFGKRWRQQRALEFDVFARRLRLVIENSLNRHSLNV